MGKFKDSIPSTALNSVNTEGFVEVLDGMHEYKRELTDSFYRSYNPLTNFKQQLLIRKLEDLGFPKIPSDYPVLLLQQMLLNSGNIMRYRGSKKGIILFLQSCTLGEVTLDVSNYFPQNPFITPSDFLGGTGFLPDDVTNAEESKYLYDADAEELDSSFSATIKTFYHNNQTVVNYVRSSLVEFLPFFESTSSPYVEFVCGGLYCIAGMYDFVNCVGNVNLRNSCSVDLLDSGLNTTSIVYSEIDDSGDDDSLAAFSTINDSN